MMEILGILGAILFGVAGIAIMLFLFCLLAGLVVLAARGLAAVWMACRRRSGG